MSRLMRRFFVSMRKRRAATSSQESRAVTNMTTSSLPHSPYRSPLPAPPRMRRKADDLALDTAEPGWGSRAS